MFYTLQERLSGIFAKLTGRGSLSEDDVDEAMREVRRALLEADVALDVARSFIDKVKAKAVKTYPVATVRDCLRSLTPRLQTYALLALNCGMTNVDVGHLRHDMLDLEAGTLTRKRVKTEDTEGVPSVTYKLWPETVAKLAPTRPMLPESPTEKPN